LINLFKKNPKFLDIASSSILSFSEKNKIFKETFSDFSIYMINFLLLLVQKKYFHYVSLILKEFRKQCNAYCNIQYGIVYSVVELKPTQMKRLEKKISVLTNNTIELINQIDESLIAGIKVKVNHQVFDGSVKAQIDQLKNNLLENN